MTRSVVVLTVLFAGLVAWERGLVRGAAVERVDRSRVGKLLSPAERENLPFVAVRLERSFGASFLYGRVDGMWRCLDAFGAMVDLEALNSVVGKLVEAEGVVRTDDPAESEVYGIGTRDTIRVSLCGTQVLRDPSGDVIQAFDVGAGIPGRDACFLRRVGERAIWSIDSDVRAEIEASSVRGLPPMVDGGLIPHAWPGWKAGVARIFVDRADGSGYELERRMVEVSPDELRRGVLPWEWVLKRGPSEGRAAAMQSHAYSLFVERTPFVEVLDPKRTGELGLENPEFTVTVAAADGSAVALSVGRPLADGRVPVWNGWSKSLLVVEPDVAALLVPSELRFAEESDENPWHGFLEEDGH